MSKGSKGHCFDALLLESKKADDLNKKKSLILRVDNRIMNDKLYCHYLFHYPSLDFDPPARMILPSLSYCSTQLFSLFAPICWRYCPCGTLLMNLLGGPWTFKLRLLWLSTVVFSAASTLCCIDSTFALFFHCFFFPLRKDVRPFVMPMWHIRYVVGDIATIM